MPAYLIVYRESSVRDPTELQQYHAEAVQMMSGGDWKMTPRVIEGAVTTLEGKAPEAVFLHEFPTVQDAKAWYYSPAYQAAMLHRQKAADYRFIIVEGL